MMTVHATPLIGCGVGAGVGVGGIGVGVGGGGGGVPPGAITETLSSSPLALVLQPIAPWLKVVSVALASSFPLMLALIFWPLNDSANVYQTFA
jgi:hypothetical protein